MKKTMTKTTTVSMLTMMVFSVLFGCASYGEECEESSDCQSDLVCVECFEGGACGDYIGDDMACDMAYGTGTSSGSGGYTGGSSSSGESSYDDYDQCNYAWSGIDDYQVESHCLAACAHRVAGYPDSADSECGILAQFDSSYPNYCSGC